MFTPFPLRSVRISTPEPFSRAGIALLLLLLVQLAAMMHATQKVRSLRCLDDIKREERKLS